MFILCMGFIIHRLHDIAVEPISNKHTLEHTPVFRVVPVHQELWQSIRVTSHEPQGFWNQRQSGCLFNSLLGSTSQMASNDESVFLSWRRHEKEHLVHNVGSIRV